MNLNLLKIGLLLIALTQVAGCGFSSSGSSGSTTVTTGIFGVVTTSNSRLTVTAEELQSRSSEDDLFSQSLSSCTVTAYELGGTDTVVATATSNSSGQYDLSLSDKDKLYRVSTDCPSGEKFSTVGKPSSDTSTRVTTNPRSTLIASMVVQNVLKALEDSIQGVADTTTQNLLKNLVKDSLDSLVTKIQSKLQEEIEAGTISDPTSAEANAITLNTVSVTNGKTSAQLETSLGTAYPAGIPTTISDEIKSTASSAAALPACDPSIPGNVASDPTKLANCVVAVAKVMRNSLRFTIGLKTATVNTVTGSAVCTNVNATLLALFPNSEFETNGSNAQIPVGYCVVKPAQDRPNRNRVFDDSHQGGGGSVAFVETNGAQVGLLSEMAKSLLNSYKYNLAGVDKMIFYRSGAGPTAAGFDGRIVAEGLNGSGVKAYYYMDSTGAFINSSWPTCSAKPCSPSRKGDSSNAIDISLDSVDWSDLNATPGTHGVALSPIFNEPGYRNGIISFSPTTKQFGGTIPTLAQLNGYLDEDRVHTDYNPFGQKEFYVMYRMAPYRDISTTGTPNNSCWDNDTSTVCLGQDGTSAYPAVYLNFTKGTAAASGYKPIASLAMATAGSATTYFAIPVFRYSNGPGVWANAFKFIKSSDGKQFRDEVGRERAIYVVTNTAACGGQIDGAGTSLPAMGASCAAGYGYNAEMNYSDCSGGGSGTCPKINLLSATPIQEGGVNMVIEVRSEIRSQWLSQGAVGGHQVLAIDGMTGRMPIAISVNGTFDLATGTPAQATYSLSGGQHFLGIRWSCSGVGANAFCGPDATGYYLVDNSGQPVQNAGATNKWPGGTTICGVGASSPTCATSANFVKILAADLTAAVFDFDPNTAGVQNFATTFSFAVLDMGPVPSPVWKCSGEPFFVPPTSATTFGISCNAADTAPSSGYITFSNKWDYYRWVNDPTAVSEVPARNTRPLIENPKNAFAYGDPQGAKSLISTAFNGWLDGAHTLDSASELNALQAFALVYMTFDQDSDRRYYGANSAVTGSTGAYYLLQSMDFINGGGTPVESMNTIFGNAFTSFKK